MTQESLITIGTRHQSHLERLKTSEAAKFDAFLKSMDADIRNVLTVGNISELTRGRLNKLLVSIQRVMASNFSAYEKVYRDSVVSLADYEAKFEKRALETVVSGVTFDLPSENQLMAAIMNYPVGAIGGTIAGKTLMDMYSGFTADQIAAIQAQVNIGYAEGQTTQQILQRIRGTRAAKWKDGALAVVKRNQETIVRTALQLAANTARESVWEQNSSVISKVRISAVLDSRTSAICRSMDGREFAVGKGPRPPFHARCRTTTVAVLKSEYAGLSKGRTRAERDPETGKIGYVSANQTYYGWLKDQPADVQDSIIGPSRGKLLRDGGLSADRFSELQLGKNFQPMTLDEMKKAEPAAFNRAGL